MMQSDGRRLRFVEGEDPDTFCDNEHISISEKRVYDIRLRKSEREMATQPLQASRPASTKEIQRVSDVFSPELGSLANQCTTAHRQDQTRRTAIQAALRHQKDVAGKIHLQQETSPTKPSSTTDSTTEVINGTMKLRYSYRAYRKT